MRRQRPSVVGRMLAATLVVAAGAASADEVRVVAANAVRAPLLAIVGDFERETGHRVVIAWTGSAGVEARIAGGEPVDVVVLGDAGAERLARTGRTADGSTTPFARVGVGVAVPAGRAAPDISSPEAVRAAILAAGTIAYSSGPSGQYVVELFERLGVAEQVRGRTVRPPPEVLVGELLARGEADLGFQQVSDLVHVPGIRFVGALPEPLQHTTTYAAALSAAAPAREAGAALLRRFSAPQARQAVADAGMTPVDPPAAGAR